MQPWHSELLSAPLSGCAIAAACSGHPGDFQLNDRELHPPWTHSSRSLEVERRFRLLASRRYRHRRARAELPPDLAVQRPASLTRPVYLQALLRSRRRARAIAHHRYARTPPQFAMSLGRSRCSPFAPIRRSVDQAQLRGCCFIPLPPGAPASPRSLSSCPQSKLSSAASPKRSLEEIKVSTENDRQRTGYAESSAPEYCRAVESRPIKNMRAPRLGLAIPKIRLWVTCCLPERVRATAAVLQIAADLLRCQISAAVKPGGIRPCQNSPHLHDKPALALGRRPIFLSSPRITILKGAGRQEESALGVREFQRVTSDASQLITGNGVNTCNRMRMIATAAA